ncbi:MAG: pyruvate carboxylase subunit B [Acidaminococcaceae bacterium]|nr:pyruvate carboxylase subunit B [Acidaminococcaceae bacterium]HAY61578.1 oxaloacetate decarboxylase subunit alpha [Acidaminococcaceae bacterium]
MNDRPVQITETVLRDGHQSLTATRMRTGDMLPVLDIMDEVGYHAVEAWGGATFDACLRFLDEDPWERLRTLRRHLRKTPIQMLLRGQNLLGYSHYADDVVEDFVGRSVENGVTIIRIFDALNDVRNLETAMRATKKEGAVAQGTLIYTTSPYHKTEDFVRIAKQLEDMGADSICIKDMAGLLLPCTAYDLVKALKAELKVPLELHTHCTTGLGEMTYLKAIEAGVDIIDTAISPFSGLTSQPCTESFVAALRPTPRDTGLDAKLLEQLAAHFRKVRTDLVQIFNLNADLSLNPQVLVSQIPGGMMSNLMNQMKQIGIADKMDEVLEEMPRVRKELGYPPLVTPTSQIVGTMAVLNVALGRYRMVPREVKDLVRGKYGRTPGPIKWDIRKRILGDATLIDHRPADDIPPQVDAMRAKLAVQGFPEASEEDLLSYIMFPEVALDFFKKHRME